MSMSSSSNFTYMDSEDDNSTTTFQHEPDDKEVQADPSSFRKLFRMVSIRRDMVAAAGEDEAAAPAASSSSHHQHQHDGAFADNNNNVLEPAQLPPFDCETLMVALDECEQELEECKRNLRKAKRKNRELLQDFADQRLSLSDLEDSYAKIKFELAQAKTDDDTLLVATQQALADRDVTVLELTRERDQLVADMKQLLRERDDLATKNNLLEECVADKDLRLLNVVADNDELKEDLKKAKRELEAAYRRIESLDLQNHRPETHQHSPQPVKVTVMTNRWTRGFRNPLRRRSATSKTVVLDDNHMDDSTEDFFQ